MKRILLILIKLLVSGVLVGLLLRRFGIEKLAGLFQDADPRHILWAGIVLMGSHVLGSVQWWVLLANDNIRISWRRVLSFYFVGLFFNNFLISGLGGDMFRMMDIKRYSLNGTSAVSTVFLDRMLGLFVLSSLSILFTPWILLNASFGDRFIVPISILILSWLVLCILLFSRRCANPVAQIIQRLAPEKIVNHLKEIYCNIYNFGRSRMLLPKLIVLSLGIQSLRIFTHYFLGKAVGIHISPVYFFMFIPVIAIMASLPISIGGLGLREQTGIILFSLVGVVDIDATVMEFYAYIVSVLTTLPGGLIFIFRKQETSNQRHSSQQTVHAGDSA